MQIDHFCSFFIAEPRQAAHDAAVGEMRRDCCAVHTILKSQLPNRQTCKVIVDEAAYFRGGRKV